MERKKLYKSSSDKQIMGVCGGLADYFNMDVTIIRIIFLVMFFAYSSGFWLYIVLGIVLPYDFQVNANHKQHTDQTFSSGQQPKDVTPEHTENWDDF